MQRLDVPENARRAFELRVVLDGRARILQMRPHSMLAPGFALVADDGKTSRTLPTPREVTYQGVVAGEAVSGVAASIVDGQFRALVYIGRNDWSLQPVSDVVASAPRADHVAYAHADILATDVRCGQGEVLRDPLANGRRSNAGPMSSTLRQCEIALDCNNYYYRRFGSDTTRTFNAATARMNQVDVIYRREVTICYSIPTIIIRTTQVYQNGPQVGCVSGPDLLDDMRARWRANHTNVQRDTAHMLSGWGSWSGIIGCAAVSVICSRTNGFGVSRVVNSNEGRNTGLVAHELGHNWSSGHCNSSPPCYIMCSGIGGCARSLTQFSTYAKNRILAHKNSRSCLSDCCAPASYAYFGVGCKGSGLGNGVPVLTATGTPKLGTDFGISVFNARTNAPAIALHNITATAIDLTNAGAPGCSLYVQNTFYSSVAVTNAIGAANFGRLRIPNLAALCGVRFYDQIVVIDPGNQLGLVFTRRGEPVLGN